MKKSYIALVLSVLIFVSCSDRPKGWGVSGKVDGDGDYTIALEAFNNGTWYVVDSLPVADGRFAYTSTTPAAYPEIMRLNLEGQYIYFPIDSIDRINIEAAADNFSTGYSLDGTAQARTIKSLDSLINVSVAERGMAVTQSDYSLKQELFIKAFKDPSVVPLYYLINKSVGGKALYDIMNSADVRFYGAVAQRFVTELPDDPRGLFLASVYKNARSMHNDDVQQWEVPETSIIDIVRTDSRGKSHSLAEMASKGDVVLLSFTAYGMESSPEYNVLLNSLYDKYHERGLQIYQLAFDGDETFWKETARNLPWTAVWNSTTDGGVVLASYNVNGLPTTFIIDRTGTIASRVDDPTVLEKELSRFF